MSGALRRHIVRIVATVNDVARVLGVLQGGEKSQVCGGDVHAGDLRMSRKRIWMRQGQLRLRDTKVAVQVQEQARDGSSQADSSRITRIRARCRAALVWQSGFGSAVKRDGRRAVSAIQVIRPQTLPPHRAVLARGASNGHRVFADATHP